MERQLGDVEIILDHILITLVVLSGKLRLANSSPDLLLFNIELITDVDHGLVAVAVVLVCG